MINIVFADDPAETVFEFQLQHDDLATIRNTGSHKFCKDLDGKPRKKRTHPPRCSLGNHMPSSLANVRYALARR